MDSFSYRDEVSRMILGFLRRHIGVVALVLAVVLMVWMVQAAVSATGELRKATPARLGIISAATLPLKTQAREVATSRFLFDHDTDTEHVVFDRSLVETRFKTAHTVHRIRVFGPAPYTLSVSAGLAGSWQPVDGLRNLDLTALPAAWTTFTATTPVTSEKLQFELIPAADTKASGLGELEIWADAVRKTVKDGSDLVNEPQSDQHLEQDRPRGATPPLGFTGNVLSDPTATASPSLTPWKDAEPAPRSTINSVYKLLKFHSYQAFYMKKHVI